MKISSSVSLITGRTKLKKFTLSQGKVLSGEEMAMLAGGYSLICEHSGDKCSLVINDYSYDGVCGFTYYTNGDYTTSVFGCTANTSGSK